MNLTMFTNLIGVAGTKAISEDPITWQLQPVSSAHAWSLMG